MISYLRCRSVTVVKVRMHVRITAMWVESVIDQIMAYVRGESEVLIIVDCRRVTAGLTTIEKKQVVQYFIEKNRNSHIMCILLMPENKTDSFQSVIQTVIGKSEIENGVEIHLCQTVDNVREILVLTNMMRREELLIPAIV